MTRWQVVFHPAVEGDLVAIQDDLRAFDPALPGRFVARMDEQVERIEMYPESGAALFGSYRRVLLTRFPYMIVYVVRRERVDVLAVLGVRRDPEWIEATVSRRDAP